MRDRLRRFWRAPATAAAVTFCVVTGMVVYLIHLEDSAFQARQNRRVSEHVSVVRAALERELNLNLNTLNAYHALIIADPALREDQFMKVSEILNRNLPALKVVELAPDGVVRYAYPESEAAKVKGLDLLKITFPGHARIVQETLRDGQVRLAGPMALFQGGTGLAARDPIYIGNGDKRRFWGFASVVVDYDRFIDDVPALTGDPDVEFAIRGKDGLGAQGARFYGAEDIFRQAVTADVRVPGGRWQLAGRPSGGWRSSPVYSGFTQALSLMSALLLTAMAYVLRRRGNQLARVATFDSLTGALRRDGFMARMQSEMRRARRYQRGLSLLILDVDHFKGVNDQWGHGAGDMVLAAISKRIAQSTRPTDMMGRLGGEEFAILCPETDLEEATALAERIREGVARHPIMAGTERISMTVSIGVGEFGPGRNSQNSWMSAVDKALYRAKSEGRNRVYQVDGR